MNYGTDIPINVNSLPSSNLVNGVPIGWHNQKRKLLQKLAKQYVDESSAAVVTLKSQGEPDSSASGVAETRKGFNQLRVQLPVMNQYYNYTKSHGGTPDATFLAKIKLITLDWVRTNVPDGKPINESNFENLLRVIGDRWADFSGAEQADITTWLNLLKTAREAWTGTPGAGEGKLIHGNHYTHHYKILLRVYQLLGLSTTTLVSDITSFAARNFPFGNGSITSPTEFTITAINQGSKIFKVAGNQTANFFTTYLNKVYVNGGTANDGWYTLVSAVLNGGNTDITVLESIPSATVAGKITGSYNDTTHDMSRKADSAGESIDMIRRDALHYHQYDMEPWLELGIMTSGGFSTYMDNGFNFLRDWILTPSRKRYEFFATNDTFDGLRWAASQTEYLQPNMMYKPGDAARVIFSYEFYKKIGTPGFQVDDRLQAMAFRADVLPSHWYYFFRWVFNGLYS